MPNREILLYVKPTERCNLTCLHCYNNTGGTQPDLDLLKLENFLVASAKEIGAGDTDYLVEVVLHGGEPTLVGAEKLQQIVQLFRYSLPTCLTAFSMQSNLTYLDSPLVQFIKEDLHSYIGTSYSPGLRFTGKDASKLDIWKQNISNLVSEGVRVYTVISLGAEAIRSLDQKELVDLLVDLKVDGFHFEPITQNGAALINSSETLYTSSAYGTWKAKFTKEFIDGKIYNIIPNSEIIRKAKTFTDAVFVGCSCRDCMRKTITINADGSIGACPNDSKVNILGTLDSTLLDILNNNKLREKLIAKERFKRLDCIDCEFISVCNGGCMQLQDCFEGKEFFSILEKELHSNPDFKRAVDAYQRTSIFN